MCHKRGKAFIRLGLLPGLLLVGLLLLLGACGDAPAVGYRVQAGDNIASIAEKFNMTPRVVAELNGLPVDATLSEGQTLTIPAPGCNLGASYEVKTGDTLSSIAKKYNTSVQALMDANGFSNANRILTGQCLIIPGPPVPTAPPPTPLPPQPTTCNHYFELNVDKNLDNIARNYGVDKKALLQENHLPTDSALIDHQLLKITLVRRGSDPGNCPPGETDRQGTIGFITPTPAPTSASAAASPTPTVAASMMVYTVQPGDTLSGIARQFGTDVNTLMRDNNLTNPNYIKARQQLKVRKKA